MSREIAQPLRFLLAGVWNTLFGYGCFVAAEAILALAIAAPALRADAAVVVSNVFAVPMAFLVYKRFVFRTGGEAWRRELPRFFAVYAATFCANLFLLPSALILLPLDRVVIAGRAVLAPMGLAPILNAARVGQILCLIVLAVASYVAHRSFSFRPAPRAPE